MIFYPWDEDDPEHDNEEIARQWPAIIEIVRQSEVSLANLTPEGKCRPNLHKTVVEIGKDIFLTVFGNGYATVGRVGTKRGEEWESELFLLDDIISQAKEI